MKAAFIFFTVALHTSLAFGGELEGLQHKMAEMTSRHIQDPKKLVMVASCSGKARLDYNAAKTNEAAVRVKKGKKVWWLSCTNDKGGTSTIQVDIVTGDVSRNKRTFIIFTP